MWRRQDEPKPPSSPETVAASLVAPQGTPTPLRELSTPGSISETLHIKGQITGQGDLYIDGEVEGSICIPGGSVIVGPRGRVTSDIEAREIVVQGKVKGNLEGRERVQIGRTGEAYGQVLTRRIAVEEGAVFRGKVETVRSQEVRKTRPAERRAATEAPPASRPAEGMGSREQ
ncbi:MAG TPA: polymer-forming cytoskeletal protein [Candidatus Acidoferrales bacterium]|nr:polymer-forming cytoskeletal protein [Candidatus Acidoferrales bacterium]